jgi:hypothetical protein
MQKTEAIVKCVLKTSKFKQIMLPEKNMEQLHQQIASIITSGKQTAYRAINAAMTLTYWEIGRLIVEEEQNGKERADYGDYLIVTLAKRLQKSLEVAIHKQICEISDNYFYYFQFATHCVAN